MKKSISILLFTLAATGCTPYSKEKFDASLQTYLGMTEKQLLLQKGIPTKTYQVDNTTKLIGYVTESEVYVPPVPSYQPYRHHYRYDDFDMVDAGGYTETYRCEVTFTIERGIVTGVKSEGNDCLAK